jgi:hypothetical protein
MTQTEYVYVYSSKEVSDVTQPVDEDGWIVKEYSGKIGIFKKDGTLTDVIDTYVKTLPESDRASLLEGIEIETQEQLRQIIQDYTD